MRHDMSWWVRRLDVFLGMDDFFGGYLDVIMDDFVLVFIGEDNFYGADFVDLVDLGAW